MFTRDRVFYFTTVFIPGIILVTSSFITFWLEWNAVPARVMIGTFYYLHYKILVPYTLSLSLSHNLHSHFSFAKIKFKSEYLQKDDLFFSIFYFVFFFKFESSHLKLQKSEKIIPTFATLNASLGLSLHSLYVCFTPLRVHVRVSISRRIHIPTYYICTYVLVPNAYTYLDFGRCYHNAQFFYYFKWFSFHFACCIEFNRHERLGRRMHVFHIRQPFRIRLR